MSVCVDIGQSRIQRQCGRIRRNKKAIADIGDGPHASSVETRSPQPWCY